MDSAGFDTLVQSFGTGSRRDGLRLLMGAALGGILAGLHVADTAAKRRHRKRRKNKKKKKNRCLPYVNCNYVCQFCDFDTDTCVNADDFDTCVVSDPLYSWRCVDGICTNCGHLFTPCCAGYWCECIYLITAGKYVCLSCKDGFCDI